MFMSTSLLETANPNASGKGNSGIKIYSLSTNEFSNNILWNGVDNVTES